MSDTAIEVAKLLLTALTSLIAGAWAFYKFKSEKKIAKLGDEKQRLQAKVVQLQSMSFEQGNIPQIIIVLQQIIDSLKSDGVSGHRHLSKAIGLAVDYLKYEELYLHAKKAPPAKQVKLLTELTVNELAVWRWTMEIMPSLINRRKLLEETRNFANSIVEADTEEDHVKIAAKELVAVLEKDLASCHPPPGNHPSVTREQILSWIQNGKFS